MASDFQCPSCFLLLQFAAKKLDRRLLHLGAEPILEIGLGDDQHPSGYDFNISPAFCKYLWHCACEICFPSEAFLNFNEWFSLLCTIRYEGALDPWLLSMWKSLNETNPSLLPRVSDINDPNLNILGDSKVHVIYYSSNEVPQDSVLSGMNEWTVYYLLVSCFLKYLFMILAIVYFTDPNKIISCARSMSPALQFHADGEPPYMLQMVCHMCSLGRAWI